MLLIGDLCLNYYLQKNKMINDKIILLFRKIDQVQRGQYEEVNEATGQKRKIYAPNLVEDTNMGAYEDWRNLLNKIHNELIKTLGNLEEEKARCIAKVIKDSDNELWKRIGFSSTILTEYALGESGVKKYLAMCVEYIRLIRKQSDEYRTIISYLKTERENV